ncbi:hypothetical protein E4U11_004053 [Claviceps purpurea]|nr:hypothetical protein E4U11_004053 [Claviceps purpurea]
MDVATTRISEPCRARGEGLDTCSGGAHNCTQTRWNVASCCWSRPTGAHAQPPPARSWLQPTTMTFNRGTSGQRGLFWPFSSNKGRQRSMAVLGCEGAASSTSPFPRVDRTYIPYLARPLTTLITHQPGWLFSPIWRWAAWQPPRAGACCPHRSLMAQDRDVASRTQRARSSTRKESATAARAR